MKLSNEKYDILVRIQRWLPALGVFYLALCSIWGLPSGESVNSTIVALASLMAATIEMLNADYAKSEVNRDD